MTFSDDDMKRLKEDVDEGEDEFDCPITIADMKRILARMEAAEATLLSCKRYQYDDGLVIVEEPDVKLYEAWRKACGK